LSFYNADGSDAGPKVQGAVDMIADAAVGGRSSMVFSSAVATTGTLTERMRITATGNVGIGTAAPSAKLDVHANDVFAIRSLRNTGNGGLSVTDTAGGIRLGTSNGSAGFVGAAIDIQAPSTWTAGTSQPSDMRFFTVPSGSTTLTERMRLDSAGNLGLGVTPSAWDAAGRINVPNNGALIAQGTSLDLGTNWYYNAGFKYATTATATRLLQTGGAYQFFTAPSGTAGNAITFTQAMTLDASGRLGIGITSMTFKLEVAGDIQIYPQTGTNSALVRLTNTGGNAYLGLDHSAGGLGGAYSLNVWHGGAYPIVFATSNIERARIDASGALLIGASSYVGYTNSNNIQIGSGLNTGTVYVNHSSATGSGGLYAAFGYNGTGIGSITQNGTTGVLYNIASDYRLKNITGPITNSGAYIDSLKPVEGTWKADGSTFVGLIAHETQEVSRTTVATGTKDGAEMQGMDYSSAEIIANLIAELQSLRARVAQLESK